MTIDHLRYGRQIRLVEIGEEGQARLEASRVSAHGAGGAAEVETLYLKRAGVKVTEAESKAKADADPDAKAYAVLLASLGVRDSEAREIADGALRALVTVRKILGIGVT